MRATRWSESSRRSTRRRRAASSAAGIPAPAARSIAACASARRVSARSGLRSTRSAPSIRSSTSPTSAAASAIAWRATAARGIASVGRAVGSDPTMTPSARSPATSPMPTIPSRRRRPCSRSDVRGMLRGYSGRRRGTNARTHDRSVRNARPTAARTPSAASPAEWRPRPIASASGHRALVRQAGERLRGTNRLELVHRLGGAQLGDLDRQQAVRPGSRREWRRSAGDARSQRPAASRPARPAARRRPRCARSGG